MIPWLIAFVFTQCVEVPIYLYAQRSQRAQRSIATRATIAFAASAITHPPLWFFASRAWVALYLAVITRAPSLVIASPFARYVLFVVLAEGAVVLVEGAFLRALSVPRPWRWALVANVSSVALGLASRALLGAP